MIDEDTKIIFQALWGLENNLQEIRATLAAYDQNIIGDNEDFRQSRIEMRRLREETELKFADLKKDVAHLCEMWGRHELEIRPIKKR